MHIIVQFQFNHEESPAAVTSVEGEVTDLLLPSVGDFVQQSDSTGKPFKGKVSHRTFAYDLPAGPAVNGAVVVTLNLDCSACEEQLLTVS